MVKRELIVANEKGIHARVAAQIVAVAQKFDSHIWLQKGSNRVYGKSILDILSLACKRGSSVYVVADGPDEEEAIEAVADLFRNRFGET